MMWIETRRCACYQLYRAVHNARSRVGQVGERLGNSKHHQPRPPRFISPDHTCYPTSFVPEHTQVFVHTYSLQRDPRYFSPFPDSFWPERWLSPELRASVLGQLPSSSPNSEEKNKVVHNTAAFIPFSAGPASCVGKPLALMELRAMFCFVLQKYQIEPADEKAIAAWEGTLRDFLTTQWGALPVRLSARF
jgi:cytochrome P450